MRIRVLGCALLAVFVLAGSAAAQVNTATVNGADTKRMVYPPDANAGRFAPIRNGIVPARGPLRFLSKAGAPFA